MFVPASKADQADIRMLSIEEIAQVSGGQGPDDEVAALVIDNGLTDPDGEKFTFDEKVKFYKY